MSFKGVIRLKIKKRGKDKIGVVSFDDEVNYYDYYNQFCEYNIDLLKMELAKANVEKEYIENKLKYKNKSLIQLVSTVATLLLAVAALFEGYLKIIAAIIVIIAIAFILLFYAIHDSYLKEDCNIYLKKISNLTLKIQIIENLIAEREKKENNKTD